MLASNAVVVLFHFSWPRFWLRFNGPNRPGWLNKQEFSGGVVGVGPAWKWQVFVAIRGPYVSNLRALCTLAENRGFVIDGGVKISRVPGAEGRLARGNCFQLIASFWLTFIK